MDQSVSDAHVLILPVSWVLFPCLLGWTRLWIPKYTELMQQHLLLLISFILIFFFFSLPLLGYQFSNSVQKEIQEQSQGNSGPPISP